MIKKIISLGMLFIIISFSLLALSGCNEKSSKYTEAEHIQRVTERIEERFMTDKFEYTGFVVYPLYDENDDLKYFLVEFEPHGFMYVLLRDEQLKGFSWLGASTSMYKMSSFLGDNRIWSPYTIDESNNQLYPDKEKIWGTDINGEKIFYEKSPYSIAHITEQKRYLIRTVYQTYRPEDENLNPYYIPAIKMEEGYLNLISNELFDTSNKLIDTQHAVQYIPFIAKKDYDL